jgi:hypothetical protein
MNKKRLAQILASLPDDTPVTAVFSYGRTFNPEHKSTIVGINVIENKDKTMTAVICAREIKNKEEAA